MTLFCSHWTGDHKPELWHFSHRFITGCGERNRYWFGFSSPSCSAGPKGIKYQNYKSICAANSWGTNTTTMLSRSEGQIYIFWQIYFGIIKALLQAALFMSEADIGSCLCVSENSCKGAFTPLELIVLRADCCEQCWCCSPWCSVPGHPNWPWTTHQAALRTCCPLCALCDIKNKPCCPSVRLRCSFQHFWVWLHG